MQPRCKIAAFDRLNMKATARVFAVASSFHVKKLTDLFGHNHQAERA